MPRGLRPTLLALPPLLAATAVAAAPLSIPIRAVNSLTGRLAAQGTAIHRGILLAVEEANAGGGMGGGRPARLLVQGDAGRIVEEGPGPVLLQAPGVRKALLGA